MIMVIACSDVSLYKDCATPTTIPVFDLDSTIVDVDTLTFNFTILVTDSLDLDSLIYVINDNLKLIQNQYDQRFAIRPINSIQFDKSSPSLDQLLYDQQIRDQVFQGFYQDEMINVIIVNTITEIKGFAWVPEVFDGIDLDQNELYNTMVIDYRSINTSVMSHELGHMLGLNHRFYNGSNCDQVKDNIMSYQPCVSIFTPDQLDTAMYILYYRRGYLFYD